MVVKSRDDEFKSKIHGTSVKNDGGGNFDQPRAIEH
jgi:hypothetical protein